MPVYSIELKSCQPIYSIIFVHGIFIRKWNKNTLEVVDLSDCFQLKDLAFKKTVIPLILLSVKLVSWTLFFLYIRVVEILHRVALHSMGCYQPCAWWLYKTDLFPFKTLFLSDQACLIRTFPTCGCHKDLRDETF